MIAMTQVYSGSTGATNISVPMASVYYMISVTATVLNGIDSVEGAKSEPSLIYVPDPGNTWLLQWSCILLM